MTDEAFYIREGDGYRSTDWTRGPWSADSQHAGPPAALLAREAELVTPDEAWITTRVSVDILRPIPVSTFTVTASVERGTKRTQLVRSVLRHGDVEIAHASVWRMVRRPLSDAPSSEPCPHAFPDHADIPAFQPPWDPSYFSAMEWRAVSGSLVMAGPAAVWMRMRHPLVADEPTSPLSRVLVAADSGNGISSALPLATHLFINVELSVHSIRDLRGEWVCLDARTDVGPDGIGVATSRIWDQSGLAAFGAQSLLVDRR